MLREELGGKGEVRSFSRAVQDILIGKRWVDSAYRYTRIVVNTKGSEIHAQNQKAILLFISFHYVARSLSGRKVLYSLATCRLLILSPGRHVRFRYTALTNTQLREKSSSPESLKVLFREELMSSLFVIGKGPTISKSFIYLKEKMTHGTFSDYSRSFIVGL